MATDTDEGKTLGAPHFLCEMCEEDSSTSYCKNCNSNLCARCVKQHLKLSATKHHDVIPIDKRQDISSSVRKQDVFCSTHSKLPLDKICDDCLVTICNECRPSHSNHALTDCEDHRLQRLSAEKIPGLMQLLHQLKHLDDPSLDKITVLQKAQDVVKSYRDKVLNMVTADADGLLKEFQIEIDSQKKLTAEISQKKARHMSLVDKHIMNLTDARNISDVTKILNQLKDCDVDADATQKFIESMDVIQPIHTIDDYFPQRKDFGVLEGKLHSFFTKKKTKTPATTIALNAPNTQPSFPIGVKAKRSKRYDNLQKKASNSMKPSIYCYKFSESTRADGNVIILYDMNERDVYEYNVNTNTLEHFKCETEIWRMVTLTSTHVIIDYNTKDIRLLNKQYKITSTMERADDRNVFIPQGLCVKDDLHFILSEISTHRQDKKTRFIEVKLDTMNTKFSKKFLGEIDLYHYWGIMNLCGKSVIMDVSDKALSMLNLVTLDAQKIDFKKNMNGWIRSVYNDAGTILVGENDGKIHLVENTKYNGVVMKLEGSASGIVVKDGRFVIISGNNIHVYV